MQSITPITTDDFKAKSNIVIGKIEIDSDGEGTHIELPDIKEISITTNIQNVVSRLCSYSFSITCLNTDNQYSPYLGTSAYYRKLKRGRKLKIYMGVEKSDTNYFWQWQLWIIDEIKLSESAGQSICIITGRNLMGLLLDYKLYYPNTFWGGTIYLDTKDGKTVYQLPNTPTMGNWDIRGAFQMSSCKVSDEATQANGVWFNTDGTKMYVLDNSSRKVFQYTLSTAFAVSSATYDSVFEYVGDEESEPTGMCFSVDGTKMYIVGDTNATAYQYTLGTAWDLSTSIYSTKSFLLTGQTSHPTSIIFSSTGNRMYILGDDKVYQYTIVMTAWDVNNASYDSKLLDVNSQDSVSRSIFFNSDLSKLFMVGDTNNTIYQYTLGTPGDISTGAYDTISKDVTDEESAPKGIFFKSDGSKMYIVGYTKDSVLEFVLDDDTIDVATGVYQASVDDIDPRDGEDEDDFSLVIEGTDFVYNKWDNTITFGIGGGVN